jgi:hypothetical protein
MLVGRQGRRRRAGRARLTRATSASRCSLTPPRASRRPRRRSGCTLSCSEERRVRDARGETEPPPAQSRVRETYESDVSVALFLSASKSAAAPALPIRLSTRLQQGEEGQGCSWRDRAPGRERVARDLRERRERRVALERLRERRGARVADLVAIQAAARRGGSGMLVAGEGRRHRTGRARLTRASSTSNCSGAPPTAPRRPRRRSCCRSGCSEERRVRDARSEIGSPAWSRARATYRSDVSVALLFSAPASAAAPAPKIWFPSRLQRGEEGQRCSWRDRAAGTELGARDLPERRQRRVALERLRERLGARLEDLVPFQAAARRGGSEMLVARQGRRHRAGRA